ncbi:MAG: ChrR family anti-sigma-E factor [Pseudomonadota bacterium]
MLDDNHSKSISLSRGKTKTTVSDNMRIANINDFGEVYSAYAAGCLDPAFALMVETQAALKPEVSRAIAHAETIAGVCLENEETLALSDRALDNTLAMIDAFEARPTAQASCAKSACEALDELLALPDPLRDNAIDAAGASGWQNLTSGIRRLKLDIGSKAEVELYRIEPGARVPEHSHKGNEFTLVVSGSFSDGHGSYGPGDLCVKSETDTHQPVGGDEGVCFALAVHEGGLRFTGLMGVVQRLLGQ